MKGVDDMQDPVYHELLFKSKEDFERTINFFRPNESDEFVVDFNKIMPVPKYLEKYLDNFFEETIVRAAAYYIYEILDIEGNSLKEEDIRGVLKSFDEPFNYTYDKFVAMIKNTSTDYKKIAKAKETVRELGSYKSFKMLGKIALISIVRHNLVDSDTWRRYNWDSTENTSDGSFDEERLVISYRTTNSECFYKRP